MTNYRLVLAQTALPAFIKKKKLAQLLAVTARAFDSRMPSLKGLDYNACLRLYAQFTVELCEMAVQQNLDLVRIRRSLYEGALDMAKDLRYSFRISDTAEAMQLCRILYRNMGIDFICHEPGDITIKRCFFSEFYSARTCDIISGLDKGLIIGLAGPGDVVFSHRITEGHETCRAVYKLTNAGQRPPDHKGGKGRPSDRKRGKRRALRQKRSVSSRTSR